MFRSVLTILALSLTLGCLCSWGQEKPLYEDINGQQAYEELKSARGAVFLDVRTKKEFDQKHIIGAVNIDSADPNLLEKLNELDKDGDYIVYSRSGHRSAVVSQVMKKNGFTSVKNMVGGLQKYPANHTLR